MEETLLRSPAVERLSLVKENKSPDQAAKQLACLWGTVAVIPREEFCPSTFLPGLQPDLLPFGGDGVADLAVAGSGIVGLLYDRGNGMRIVQPMDWSSSRVGRNL